MTTDHPVLPGLPAPQPPHPSSDHHHRQEQEAFLLTVSNTAWGANFATLCQEIGIENWRRAAFIAWLALPTSVKEPKTKRELAGLLGLSPHTNRFAEWEKQPSTQAMVIRMSSATLIAESLADVDAQLATAAKKEGMEGYYNRQLYYRRIGVLQDGGANIAISVQANNDLRQLTTEELRQMAKEEN